jgi:hypothetical protein
MKNSSVANENRTCDLPACSAVNQNTAPPLAPSEDPSWSKFIALSLTIALDGSEWSKPRSGRFSPGKESRYPFYRRLGGPQGQSGRGRQYRPIGIRSQDHPALSESLYL